MSAPPESLEEIRDRLTELSTRFDSIKEGL